MLFYGTLHKLRWETEQEMVRLFAIRDNPDSSSWDKIQQNSNHLQYLLNQVNRFSDNYYPLIASRRKQMAKTKKTQGAFEGFTLINIELTEAEKKAFKSWLTENTANSDVLLTDLMHQGYKFSVSYSPNQAMFYGSITSQSDDNEDYRCTVTSHAKNWYTALMLSYYKWDKLSKRVLTQRTVANEDDIG